MRFQGVQVEDLGGNTQIVKDCGTSVPSSFSPVLLFVTPWTLVYQAPLSMGFSRQEYWSGLPFPSPGDHLHPGIKPGSPALQAESWLSSEPPGTTVLKCKMVKGWRCKDCRRGGLERCRSVRTFTTASVLHFLPALIPSLPLFLYPVVGVISQLCGSASICSWQFF